MNLSKLFYLACVLLVLAGCKQPETDYTTVAVYPSQRQCGIDDKMMPCQEVAAYLRDTLKLPPEHQVVVSSVGIDPLPKEDNLLDKIAETISAAGFHDVRTARFDLK